MRSYIRSHWRLGIWAHSRATALRGLITAFSRCVDSEQRLEFWNFVDYYLLSSPLTYVWELVIFMLTPTSILPGSDLLDSFFTYA